MSLSGKQIVITRAEHQARELSALLLERGAVPLLYPCIDIVPPEDTSQLDYTLKILTTFDWLLLTSTNTVYALQNRFAALGIRDIPDHMKVAAVGTSTAHEAYETFGVQAEILPEEHTASSLADMLSTNLIPGTRFFLPQSEIARPDLAAKLTAAGGDVTAITAYRTVIGTGGIDLPRILVEETIDAITFTSSSTVENFVHRTRNEGGDFNRLDGICVACIGSVTAETAHKHGFENIIVPQEFTLAAMVAALEDSFSGR